MNWTIFSQESDRYPSHSVLAVQEGEDKIGGLDAAVEAARAGKQGRDFAVVASEVRNLAQATREIKGLISSSVERVTSGTELLNEA